MSKPAYLFLKTSVMICIICLAVSLLMLVYAGDMTIQDLSLFRAAKELYTMPQGILLLASAGSVFLEDRIT